MRYTVYVAAALATLSATVQADIVEYRIPNTPLVVVLQGKATVNPGRTVSFMHPKFGKLVFGLNDATIHKLPSMAALAQRKLGLAAGKNDADAAMEAARFALKHGLLRQFYGAVDKVLEIDPKHQDALRVVALKRKIDQPLGDATEEEQHLRSLVRDPAMKVALSQHFILLHDTPEKPQSGRRKPRCVERLELLELVYESFLQKFYSKGVPLQIPDKRLMVVLFHEHDDYLRFATNVDPALQSAAGFWNSDTNVSVFFDQGTHDSFQGIKTLADELQRTKDEVLRQKLRGVKDIVRMANTFAVLAQVAQENSDIEVVTHEATHQMAGNTGLMPRHVQIPIWVHEGLATYFEAPKEATWSGFGAVNQQRLMWYRALETDTTHSNIDFIVGDQIFSYALSQGAKLHGYGQSWALTHFLIEEHFDKLMAFYRRLGELPPDIKFSPDTLTKVFNEVFGDERDALDAQWRRYMRSLKTDMEMILDGKS